MKLDSVNNDNNSIQSQKGIVEKTFWENHIVSNLKQASAEMVAQGMIGVALIIVPFALPIICAVYFGLASILPSITGLVAYSLMPYSCVLGACLIGRGIDRFRSARRLYKLVTDEEQIGRIKKGFIQRMPKEIRRLAYSDIPPKYVFVEMEPNLERAVYCRDTRGYHTVALKTALDTGNGKEVIQQKCRTALDEAYKVGGKIVDFRNIDFKSFYFENNCKSSSRKFNQLMEEALRDYLHTHPGLDMTILLPERSN